MNQILFEQLPIDPQIQRAITEMGFTEPTPIQAQSIPLILEGHDVVGRSQTGTGKTAAFGIPAIQMVDPALDRRMAQVLLLCPTRELAVQACEELKKLARYVHGVRVCAVYGGAPIERQIVQLKDANIIVGTPGRVMDHMRRKTLKIANLKMVILDEADEMLSMGFREDIETILTEAPEERQTVLFSATMPSEIMKLISNYQKDPQLVEINKSQVALNSIEQFYYDLPTGRKNDALALLLHYHNPSRSIIFCNTKKMVEELSNWLIDQGFKAEGLHGDLKQSQRTVVMDAFKAGRTAILVATDVAARGIDVDDINCVFNYDIPQNAEYYVHRIGRTGRAGKSGAAHTLCCGRFQLRQMEQISRIAKAEVKLTPVPMPEEILNKQHDESAQQIRDLLTDKTDFPYMDMVLSLMEKKDDETPSFTAEQIAAAALEQLYSGKLKKLPDAKGLNREAKRRSPKDYAKLLISAGHNARMVPNFIVGAIAERTALSGRDIGKIEIFEDNTTVEIPHEQLEEVLEAMQDCRINGTRVTTSVMKAKTHGDRSYRNDRGGKGYRNDRKDFGDKKGGWKKPFDRDGKKGEWKKPFDRDGKKGEWKKPFDRDERRDFGGKKVNDNDERNRNNWKKFTDSDRKDNWNDSLGRDDHKKGEWKNHSDRDDRRDFGGKKGGSWKKPFQKDGRSHKKASYSERFASYDKKDGGRNDKGRAFKKSKGSYNHK